MQNNFKQVQKFDKWMRRVKNIHYSSTERMSDAYQRIEPLTADRAIIDFKIKATRQKIALN